MKKLARVGVNRHSVIAPTRLSALRLSVEFTLNRGLLRLLQTGAGLLLLAALGGPIRGEQSVDMIWNPSPDAGVAGYKIHYGNGSRQYANIVDVGPHTTGTVAGLLDGALYYFAVTAYATNGASSSFSNEILFSNTPPAISGLCDRFVPKGTPVGTLSFTVWDAEDPAEDLSVTATSSNPALIPNNNLVLAGTGTNRTIKIVTNVPPATNLGSTTITLSARDGFSAAIGSFKLTICGQSALPKSPLTLEIRGPGAVTPNWNGSNLLVGATYEIVATPNPDKIFAGWSGGQTASTKRLTFVMGSNLVLRASFTPHPFAGAYNGLFYETDEVRAHSAGFFWAQVQTSGLYSARLDLKGGSLAWTGQFGAGGRASSTLPRPATNALAVSLQLDRTNHTDQITGQVTDGAWLASLLADRAIGDALNEYGAYQGRYTLAMPGLADPRDGPPGTGFGFVKVNAKGTVTLTGETADGKAISQTALLSRGGEWPLYVPLYGGRGLLLGWLTFTNRPADDLTGLLSWIKPTKPLAKYYPGGFTNESVALGCRYDTNLVWGLTHTLLALGEGNLGADLTNAVSWVVSNRVVITTPGGLPVGLDPMTGIFRGVFLNPDTGTTGKFGGVVLQRLNTGAGYCRGTNQFGWAVLEAGQ
jgi:hypothetical protein